MTNIAKIAPRRFELTWDWCDLKLELDWNQIVNAHALANQVGICIHWQARPKSEASVGSRGFGKSESNKFGRSWGVYVVHIDEYLSPPDNGNSNKGIQIPEFWCTKCSLIDVAEERNKKNPVAVLWFPGLSAKLENKNVIIKKVK